MHLSLLDRVTDSVSLEADSSSVSKFDAAVKNHENEVVRAVAESVTRRPATVLIDGDDNEYVIAHPHDEGVIAEDRRLVADLILIFVSAAVGGSIMHVLQQPVVIGFVLAGSIIGPGGFDWVHEPVQIETLSTFGITFITFSVGVKMSLKLMLRVKVLLCCCYCCC